MFIIQKTDKKKYIYTVHSLNCKVCKSVKVLLFLESIILSKIQQQKFNHI